ncbi:hypothetical protein [Flavobacterium filum]|uniref:hypothetical protein n=1 Tax=Flavobacterium filum TaxID=370974 RepID=UPI0023F30B7C|nr:hypothetical protein [Flavobacterium filum]
MEEQKPKSIRTIGLIVSIFSGFIIFSNGMGALAYTIIGLGENQNRQIEKSEFNLIKFLFENYISMCLIMVTIGVMFLVGGLNIRKYKMWANKLLTYLSIFLIAIIWTLMIAMSSMTAGQNDMEIFSFAAIFTALFCSTPIGLLIWFLNKQKIKKHFA